MQIKQLHNTKEKINHSWSLSLCSQYSAAIQHKFAFSSTDVSNILWSLMRLRFVVRTSPAMLNKSFYWSRWRDWSKEYYITNQFV